DSNAHTAARAGGGHCAHHTVLPTQVHLDCGGVVADDGALPAFTTWWRRGLRRLFGAIDLEDPALLTGRGGHDGRDPEEQHRQNTEQQRSLGHAPPPVAERRVSFHRSFPAQGFTHTPPTQIRLP